MLCLTEGETSTLGAGINLAKMRREELAAASEELRVSGSVMLEDPIRRTIPYRHAGTVTPGGVR